MQLLQPAGVSCDHKEAGRTYISFTTGLDSSRRGIVGYAEDEEEEEYGNSKRD
jgi:hypothetical protein